VLTVLRRELNRDATRPPSTVQDVLNAVRDTFSKEALAVAGISACAGRNAEAEGPAEDPITGQVTEQEVEEDQDYSELEMPS